MAWNEPGGGNKDPWGGKGGDQGPPDLDEVVRKLQERLGGLFGGKGPKSNGDDGGGGGGGGARGGFPSLPGGINKKMLGIGAGVLVVIWLASGIYIIEPAERGVVLRFGGYVDTTDPGPHWRLPYPFESVIKVNVDQVSTFTHNAVMLTKDENIVDVELTVQARKQDAADFLFQDRDPEKSLKDATEAVVRTVIGRSKLDYIVTEGRGAISTDIQTGTQALMNQYKTGLLITSVNMQPAKPPEQVKDAFDDAIKAREDKERLENKAEAYVNEVLPKARGEAARIEADAMAYRDKVIAESEGEAARFVSVLGAYQQAPEVTRERLYLETMEQVLGDNSKVLIDAPQGNTMMYLPLDQMLKGRSAPAPAAAGSPQPQARVAPEPEPTPERSVNRDRRTR
jgi:membrane protease subunit HflK